MHNQSFLALPLCVPGEQEELCEKLMESKALELEEWHS